MTAIVYSYFFRGTTEYAIICICVCTGNGWCLTWNGFGFRLTQICLTSYIYLKAIYRRAS